MTAPLGKGGADEVSGGLTSFNQNGNLNPFILTDTNKNPNAIIQVVGRNITDNQGNTIAYNLGIDATDVKYADLISRVVKINGNIHGRVASTPLTPLTKGGESGASSIKGGESSDFITEVNIKTGNDKAYYNTDKNGNKNNNGFNVSSKPLTPAPLPLKGEGEETNSSNVEENDSSNSTSDDSSSTKPEFAIDSTAFGGIYAGRINFIATEEGVAVRTRSDLIASTDDINFDVNGNIILEEEGSLYAKRNINLNNKINQSDNNSNHQILNKSTIASENDTNINTDELINSTSTSSSPKAKIYALNDINITNTKLIDNLNNGLINAGNNIRIINNDKLNNENGFIVLRSNIAPLIRENTNTNSTTNPKITIDTKTSLNNTNGSIISNGNSGDIDINVLTDYIINGTLYSNSNINIKAKNIKNYSDVISANNITFTANNGNIYNGSESTNATIIAMNDIIFNILKNETNTGSLYNYGKISANNNIEINAEDSIYNGLTTGSNATITANNNATIIANNRIINKGYIQSTGLTDQSTGQKIQGTGNLTLTTNAEINSDYDLGNSSSSLDNILKAANNINNNTTISPEVQSKLDNINNITDYNELNNLLKEVKTEDQYYLVQNRIRLLNIQGTLKEIQEEYVFNPEEWTIGNEIIIDYEYNEETTEGTEIKEILTEELLQERLQTLLQGNYEYEDWSIEAKLSEAEQNIDNEIQAQNERYIQYNQTQKQLAEDNYNIQKEQAREQYIKNNGNDDGFNYEPFEWMDYTLEQYVNNNSDIEINGIIDSTKKQTLLQQAETNIKSQRLNEIQSVITSQQQKATNGLNNINWSSLTNEQLQEQLSDILGNNYNPTKWSINDYNEINPLTSITNEYLSALRINNIDTNKTEQTGIHNYGRLYSNNNSEFNSNSVLHNNKGALIYSNNNINFNINKVLFNNENSMGQGIFANNDINIRGFAPNTKLNKLINYDGRIEANNNIDIRVNTVLNYGSDTIDIRQNPYLVTLAQTYGYPAPGLYETKMIKLLEYISTLTSNSSHIQSNNGDINIQADNSLINYNSNIYGNNVKIISPVIVNTKTEFQVIGRKYWQYKGKSCGWYRWRYKCRIKYKDWSDPYDILLSTSTPSRIIAKNDLVLVADNITNGSIKESNTDYSPNGNNIPYTPQQTLETTIDSILNTGTTNPLDFISDQLPQGNYGIFRQTTNPNSNYLFETDSTLVDVNKFLGSQYFMNRIGLDPDTIDLKFLGDSYFEHELIRRAIEQQSLLTNNTNLDPQEIKQQIDNLYNSMTQEKAQQLNLTIGEPLTEQQRNQLTEDTIWYVKQEITLPNGEIYTALVPQIFYCNETLARLENERILNETGSMLAGTNIILQAKGNNHSPLEGESTIASDSDARVGGGLFDDILTTLSNSGTITAKNTLAITDFDTINNITSSIRDDDINSLSQDKFNNQATLSAGNTLIITTTENGTVNNLSGMITLNSNTNNNNNSSTQNNTIIPSIYDNLLYIKTGTLNNATLSQQEETKYDSKKYKFKEIKTHIGSTATIHSNNSHSNISINTNDDINMKGANIIANNNSNILLNSSGDINISTLEDYNYRKSYTKNNGGIFRQKKVAEEENEQLINISSTIKADEKLSINSKNDINIIGSDINAYNAELNAKNNISIISAVDKNRTINKINKKGLTYSVEIFNEELKIFNKKSQINVAKNLNTTSGNNTNFIGVDIYAYNGNIISDNEFNLMSVQDYEYSYNFYSKKRKDFVMSSVGLGIGAVGLGVSFIPGAQAVGIPIASAGLSSAAGSLFDGQIYAKQITTESTTQIKSQINIDNLFNSSSSGNTNIISSDIIAGSLDSKINITNDGKLIILDLDNSLNKEVIKGKKRADFNFTVKYGKVPQIQDFNTSDRYDEIKVEPTPVDNYIKDVSQALSDALKGIEEYFNINILPDKWNSSLQKAIKKLISEKSIEKGIKSALKSGTKYLLEKIEKNINDTENDNEENNNDNNSEKFPTVDDICGKKCKIKVNKVEEKEEVKSIIKFGGVNPYEE